MSGVNTPEDDGRRRTSGGGYGNPWPEEKRLEVAQLLARGLSAAEAGRRTEIPETTIRGWKADPEFSSTVTRLRAELLDEVAAALTGLGRLAVSTLGQGMKGEATPVQVRAATATLDLALKLREAVTLEERVRALEERAEVL